MKWDFNSSYTCFPKNILKSFVLVGIDDDSKQKVAVKIIDKKKLDSKLHRKVEYEINNMKKLSTGRHPNIVELKEVIETSDRICIVMEYCIDGDLLNLVTR